MPEGRRIPIARLGVRMLLDQGLDHFTYLGRGPMENYADRKRGSDVSMYSSTVAEQRTPYAKPMESGNHEDVRWAALTGTGLGLPGLVAQADGALLQVSAQPYTDEVMTPIEYAVDLPPSESTVLTLAARTLGVGSNGCGPRPLDPYIVWSEPATFSYVLRPIAGALEDLSLLGRTPLPPGRVAPVLARRDEHGKVELITATKDAKIEYQAGGSASSWQAYSGAFEHEPSALLSVRARAEGCRPYEGVVAVPALDRRARWKVSATSSFERGEGEPAHVLDGSLDTFWHSRWSPPIAPPPHSLTIDFGQPLNVAAVVYEARRDMDHGHVKDYEVYLSRDGTTWGEPVARGTFPKGALRQTIRLSEPISGRFLKFVALSEQSGGPYATAAELNVIEAGN
jgi:beta-galactosidase